MLRVVCMAASYAVRNRALSYTIKPKAFAETRTTTRRPDVVCTFSWSERISDPSDQRKRKSSNASRRDARENLRPERTATHRGPPHKDGRLGSLTSDHRGEAAAETTRVRAKGTSRWIEKSESDPKTAWRGGGSLVHDQILCRALLTTPPCRTCLWQELIPFAGLTSRRQLSQGLRVRAPRPATPPASFSAHTHARARAAPPVPGAKQSTKSFYVAQRHMVSAALLPRRQPPEILK